MFSKSYRVRNSDTGLPQSHWQAASALVLMSMVLSIFQPLLAQETVPTWWTDGDPPVIEISAEENNLGPANVGQAKWVVLEALRSLGASAPDIAVAVRADLDGIASDQSDRIIDLTVPDPKSDEWIEVQKSSLTLGQLKSIALPFYNHLNSTDADWVKSQLDLNHGGTATLNEHYWQVSGNANYTESGYYPWDPTTPLGVNTSMATIGQLKAIFALRFESLNYDAAEDAWKLLLVDFDTEDEFDHVNDIDPNGDFDDDGLSNLLEYQIGFIGYQADSDGDGYGDLYSYQQEVFYKMNAADGTVVSDSSTSERDGTLITGFWDVNSGISYGAVNLMTTSDRIDIPQEVFDAQTNLSVTFWFKTDSASNTQVLLNGVDTSNTAKWSVVLENGSDIRLHTGNNEFLVWNYGRSLNDNLWHQLTVVRDYDNDEALLYIDGYQFGQAQAISHNILSVASVSLGLNANSLAGFDPLSSYTGLIDEMRIYSRVLTASSVEDLFGLNDFDADGLPDDYELSIGDSLADLSGADDFDGDGESDRYEFENSTDPFDYFNGVITNLTMTGDDQTIYVGESTPLPIVFTLEDTSGVPIPNAPITLNHTENLGYMKTPEGAQSSDSLSLMTDSVGQVSIYFHAN
ncbi:MAG: LamG domain-containing protein [Akkermansiaceae bacterium]